MWALRQDDAVDQDRVLRSMDMRWRRWVRAVFVCSKQLWSKSSPVHPVRSPSRWGASGEMARLSTVH